MKRSLFILLFVFVLLSLACSLPGLGGGNNNDTSASNNETPNTVEAPAQPEATVEEAPVEEPTEAAPQTEESTSEKYYKMEFGDDFDWEAVYVNGNTTEACDYKTEDGHLRVQLAKFEETGLKFFNNENIYQDVVVRTEVENNGNTKNGFSLLCRVNKDGFYEFRVTSGQLYALYRYDYDLKEAGKNPYVNITNGGLTEINPGERVNEIELGCIGERFVLKVNGTEIKSRYSSSQRDEMARYAEGGVGLGAFIETDAKSDVDMEFTYFEVAEP